MPALNLLFILIQLTLLITNQLSIIVRLGIIILCIHYTEIGTLATNTLYFRL